MDWSAYVPAGVALFGVLYGLRMNRRWNQRIERRDACLEFIHLASQAWTVKARMEIATRENGRVDAELKKDRLDILLRSQESADKVGLLVRRDTYRTAQVMTRKVDSAAEFNRLLLLFQLQCRRDLNHFPRQVWRDRRDLRQIRKKSWYKDYFLQSKTKWWESLPD